jgi:hypothetical protein
MQGLRVSIGIWGLNKQLVDVYPHLVVCTHLNVISLWKKVLIKIHHGILSERGNFLILQILHTLRHASYNSSPKLNKSK